MSLRRSNVDNATAQALKEELAQLKMDVKAAQLPEVGGAASAVHCKGRAAVPGCAHSPMTLPPLFLGVPTGTPPPGAQIVRRDADVEPLSLPELPGDIRDQILIYAINYSKEFEDAPNLPEDRVGVPYPQGHALHGKCKEDFAIPEVGVCGVFPKVCREYLVTALLTTEKEYWEHPSRGQNFGNVLAAIHRRDGVHVVTLPANNKLNLMERLALQCMDEKTPLPWPNAIAIVLRARHWYAMYVAQHVDGANFLGKRSPTSNNPVSAHGVDLPYGYVDGGLRAAAQIVALAQALVRLRDAGKEDLAQFLTLAITYPTCNPGGMKTGLTSNNTQVTYYYHTLTAYGPKKVDEFIHEAEAVIKEYGPPDAWNTSGVRTLSHAFEALPLVDTDQGDIMGVDWEIQNEWRGTNQNPPIPPPSIVAYKASAEAVAGVLGTRSIQLKWPVGLYDTSNATDLSFCFSGCDTFSAYLHGWNTANVADMRHCFSHCKVFDRPLQSWNVGQCGNFVLMFNNCAAFNQPLDAWVVKQASAVYMFRMFAGCAAFAQPLDNWYDQLKNRFAIVEMFAGATAWLARARRQQVDGSQFFSRLAPHVSVVTGTLSAIKDPDPSTSGDSSR